MKDLGRPVLLAAAVVICGAVMTILDTTIVNVAIDRLGVVFDSRLATIQWVSTAYLLSLAAVIPLTGWMVDRFGTRHVFIGAVALFVAGSTMCGLAWSAGSLIGFRVVQGLGGGMVMPTGMTILARAAGQERMGRVMALVGVPMLLAPALGPIIGGALVDSASWRLIFFINVPIGLFTLVLASRVLINDAVQRPGRLDLVGAALLSPGLAALTGALTTGLIALVVAGVVLIGGFIWHALRTSDPLIDLRIFKDRVVAAAAATTFIFGGAFFGSMFLLALYYQLARDLSAFHTGLLLVPQAIGAMLTMPIAGKLTDKNGAGGLVLGGVTLVILGTLPFAFDAPGPVLAIGLFLRGAGMGATLMPAMASAYQVLPEAQVARAASALEIVQRAGASLGIALLAILLQSRLGSVSLSDVDHIPSSAATWTFVWAIALTALTLVPALFLPRRAISANRSAVAEPA